MLRISDSRCHVSYSRSQVSYSIFQMPDPIFQILYTRSNTSDPMFHISVSMFQGLESRVQISLARGAPPRTRGGGIFWGILRGPMFSFMVAAVFGKGFLPGRAKRARGKRGVCHPENRIPGSVILCLSNMGTLVLS